jgi:hypothetical protein
MVAVYAMKRLLTTPYTRENVENHLK